MHGCAHGACYDPLYVFKGALRAPDPACDRARIAPREAPADRSGAEPARSWLATRGTAPRRRAGGLPGPNGPRRRRRALIPRGPHGRFRITSAATRTRGAGHPSGTHIVKPCKIAVKGARYARVATQSHVVKDVAAGSRKIT